jgi:hypothetical protein
MRDHRAILLKMGEALANAGRGKRAADVFHQAAVGAPAAEALDLRRRAADQLMRCGHFDEGVAALERVLASVGVRLTKTPLGAIVQLLFFRFLLLLRGLRYRERDLTLASGEALVRLDTCRSAAFCLGVTDTVRSTALQARALRLALRVGEPYRLAICLAVESVYSAMEGSRARAHVEKLATLAEQAAKRSGEVHAMAWAAGAPGTANYMLGRWRSALDLLDRSRELLAQCVGVAWELDTMCFFAVNCLAQLGDLKGLAQRSSSYLREAGDRGDLYATVNLRIGFGNLRWLIADDPDWARTQIDDAMSQWSKRGFHLEHFYELLARTNVDLYDGKAREAHARVRATWPALRRSLMPWKIQSLRILALNLRARAALAVAELGDDRASLLRAVLRDARRLERENIGWATPLAKLLRAGVARVRADARAASHLREAIAGFEAVDMSMHATVARQALAVVLANAEGAQLAAAAEAWFTEQTVRCPAGFVAMLAPGFAR